MANESEKMEMVSVFKSSNGDLLWKTSSIQSYDRHYLAPSIPQKVMDKLVKYYDSHLRINSVVAFYDSTILGSCKAGLLFTDDGLYYKFLGKPIYIQYADIIEMNLGNSNELTLQLSSVEIPQYTIIDSTFDMYVLKKILQQLSCLDAKHGQSSSMSSGKINKLNLPLDKQEKCQKIIHTASAACGGVGTGLAQIPASDNAVIVPIQITMITALGKVFELNITEGAAKGIIASAGASVAGRALSQFLVGWIPIVGNAINTATAAGITEAIGWLAVKNFYARWIEDRNKGRYEGMADGYAEASEEYERKLRKQAEEFLKKTKDFECQRDEYEKLLNEYEDYIATLEKSSALPNQVSEMKSIYLQLQALQSA